jgi:Fe-S-cluster containining protein
MKLKVIQHADDACATDAPWYADGLKFTCSQCGNCCTGAPGYVWVSDQELARLAAHLRLSVDDVIDRYGRRIGGRVSLKERRTPQGLYDCIFLQEVKVGRGASARVKKVCSVYEVRPLQCRTWPFWEGNLASQKNWESAGKRCHGINAGARTFTRQEIEKLKDATDWPEKPPTSAGK